MKNAAQKRFELAKLRLSKALEDLEHNALTKIKKSKEMAYASQGSEDELLIKIKEQESIIENLNSEINKMQKTIEEIGKESEFSKEKNRFLADKIFKFKSQGSSFVSAIEADLVRINEIINQEK